MLFPSDSKIHDTTLYFDDILSIYYPLKILAEDMELHYMPSFSKDIKHEYPDGGLSKGFISYHTGNVTGFETVHLKSCKEPTWKYTALFMNCIIIFPLITIKYSIKTQLTYTHIDTGRRFRERDFGFMCNTKNIQATIEVVLVPRHQVPVLNDLAVISDGKQLCYVMDTEIPEELINSQINHNFSFVLRRLVEDVYWNTISRTLGSVPYSLERLKSDKMKK